MKQRGVGPGLGLGVMSEEWEHHCAWRVRKESVVPGDNSRLQDS